MSSRVLGGDVAYVKMPNFFPGMADQVLGALDARTLRGVILDLRGNGGGAPREVTRLLGAFAHGRVTSHHCDVHGNCVANRTDDSVSLLNLRLVVLTDRACASACDDFSAAIKFLGLGTLVGTRIAGVVAGPQESYLLSDNSMLLLPAKHYSGPNKEVIDGIGVPADHHAPLTAYDVSTGRDPGLDKALRIIRQ